MSIYNKSIKNNTKAMHLAIQTGALFCLFSELCKGKNIKNEVMNRCSITGTEYEAICLVGKTRSISISSNRMNEIYQNTIKALVKIGSVLADKHIENEKTKTVEFSIER